MKLVGIFRPGFVSQRTRSADIEAAGGQHAFTAFHAKSRSKIHNEGHVQILSSVNSVSEPFRQAQGPELVEGLCALCDPMYFGIHHHSRTPCSFDTWRKLSRVIITPTVLVSNGGSTPSL